MQSLNLKFIDKTLSLKKYEEIFKNSLHAYNSVLIIKEKISDSQVELLRQNDYDLEYETNKLEKEFTQSSKKIILYWKKDLLDKIQLFINKSNNQIFALGEKMRTTLDSYKSAFSNRPDLLSELNFTFQEQEKSINEEIFNFKQLIENELKDLNNEDYEAEKLFPKNKEDFMSGNGNLDKSKNESNIIEKKIMSNKGSPTKELSLRKKK